jgi:hypothetical protein
MRSPIAACRSGTTRSGCRPIRAPLAILLSGFLAAAHSADEKPPNRVERGLDAAGKGVEKAAKRTGKALERAAKKTVKGVERAADSTDEFIKKQTK